MTHIVRDNQGNTVGNVLLNLTVFVSFCILVLIAWSIWYGAYSTYAKKLEIQDQELENYKSMLASSKSLTTLETAIQEIPPKYGVDSTIITILLDKESDGKMNATRFEPSLLPKMEKLTKNKEEARQFASSHCAFQVLGVHAYERKIPWYKLYDPEICTEVAMNLWAKKREVCKKDFDNTYDILRCTARRYNGSGKRAERYADDFMKQYARLKINGE